MQSHKPATRREELAPLNLEAVLLEVARILREEEGPGRPSAAPPERAAA